MKAFVSFHHNHVGEGTCCLYVLEVEGTEILASSVTGALWILPSASQQLVFIQAKP